MCIRWEHKVKISIAEVLRGVNSTIFDAQGSRIDSELGKRDCVTGTALEKGCELDEVADTPVVSGSRKQNENSELHKAVVVQRQALTARTLLKIQRLSSSSPSRRSSTSLSRCRGRYPVSQNAFSKPERFHSQRIQKIVEIRQVRRPWRFTRLEDSEKRGDFTVFSTQSR